MTASLFFSCNVTKHLTEKQKLLVRNEIILDEKNLIKKDAGLNTYEINQIVKPEPNSKIFGLPVELKLYYLFDVEKREQFVKERNDNCSERKKSKISKVNKKIKSDEKKLADTQKEKSKRKIRNKITELENKKEKINDKQCNKYKWLKNLGEEPVLYNVNDEYRNKRKLNILLKNYGYYNAKIDISSKPKRNNEKKMIVSYHVIPGNPHVIRNIRYNIEDTLLHSLCLKDTINSELKSGKRLDIKYLESERKRISDYLKNQGYYKFSQEYIFFTIDTLNKNLSTDITVNITNPRSETGEPGKHKKFRINKVFIYPDFKPALALREKENYFLRNDTLIYYSKNNQKYNFIYNDIPKINPQTIVRNLYVAPGKLFNLNDINATYRYLASLQLITITDIKLNEKQNNVDLNDTLSGLVDCEIRLTQDSLQSYEVAAEITNTSGNIGIQSNLRYKHNNLFRNTEVLDLKLNFALKRIKPLTESLDTLGFFNSIEYGFDMGINFPRLLAPVPLKGFIKRSNPKTILNIKYDRLKEPDHTSSVAGVSYGYSWFSTNTINNDFKPITGDLVKLINPSDAFMAKIISESREENYRNRFIFGSSYRFTFNNQLYTGRNHFFYLTVNTKLAGNSLYAIKKWTNADTTINGGYEIADNTFAQFFKTDIDFRYYRKLKRKNDKLVFRAFGGIAYPYGNLKVMPFIEQYFAGGANDIRAWEERTLGPGSSVGDNLSAYANQRADIKLECNFEYRMNMFDKFEGAIFLDAGNIWAVNDQDQRDGAMFEKDDFYKEIALGTGIGIRYDLSIVVIRLDLGVKVFDPALTENNRFIYPYIKYARPFEGARKRLFYEDENGNFMNSVFSLNIGIGYPF
jgi:outer membrane protein assembly factor BamA